ncbi:MAG: Maf and M48 domain-containing protein [Candidatus Omnitrophica bacterium]|nr:Maf and M48 domain-containing protein [Candidatus Omnitrophota bacterium]
MRDIYLASNSRPRKKLLKIFGLKFKVLPVNVKEDKKPRGKSYSGLVQRNALKKARAAAEKVQNAVIIAADTITVQDGKIFGKPKNIIAAKRMLKKLSLKPQWVYTGLALIDKSENNSKVFVGVEKTKVYMDKLTDQDIKNYFTHTSPLDKAGSFDIQGRGAFFIRKIEGCFYNVVGLPIRKLYQMLRKSGVIVFLLLGGIFIAGCTTEYNIATKQEETYFYSTDKEVAMGDSIAKQIEKEYKPVNDPLMQKRVEDIGEKIAAVCDRKDIIYHFIVLDEDEVNAVSLPGGHVYIFRGLIEKATDDDQLAGVIAHEVGHIVARHSIKKLQGSQIYTVFRVLLAQAAAEGSGVAADQAFTELMLGYSREDELLADQLAARYAKLAGYDPKGMIAFLGKLEDINKRRPPREYSYYKTHPYVPDRIRVVKEELGEKITFDDYINIEQKPHGK